MRPANHEVQVWCFASDKETTCQAKKQSSNVQKVYRQSLCKPLAKPLLYAQHLAPAPTAQQWSSEQGEAWFHWQGFFVWLKEREKMEEIKSKDIH